MLAKTMEGLIGARNNINMVDVPMRAYKEARRKGNTGAMERAMGYVCDFADEAESYKKKADEGMKQEAKQAAEEEKLRREEAIRKQREERKAENEKRLADAKGQESAQAKGDSLEVSQEGKAKALSQGSGQEGTGGEAPETEAGREPAIYTKTGEVNRVQESVSISLAV